MVQLNLNRAKNMYVHYSRTWQPLQIHEIALCMKHFTGEQSLPNLQKVFHLCIGISNTMAFIHIKRGIALTQADC